MKKVDFTKQYKELYQASAKTPSIVQVPKLNYLMVDGAGYPAKSDEFQPAMGALFGLAYTLKFSLKMGPDKLDFKLTAPEGLWWMANDTEFDVNRPDDWRWTLMSAVPDFVDAKALKAAKGAVKSKQAVKALDQLSLDGSAGEVIGKVREAKKRLEAVDKVRLKALKEGTAIQMMHIGPYDKEEETIAVMLAFAEENGYVFDGKHHEIWLSDPRRVAPEKLKTIIRHPVRPASGR